ncbi:hypothetical protein QT971_16860 [Microcoleus sp. herbarium19]|uniref:hypothetical protein n=1 Tax=Microcoleus sp. herbarium13 TaxID=3055438 RepID=UPI002FD3023C
MYVKVLVCRSKSIELMLIYGADASNTNFNQPVFCFWSAGGRSATVCDAFISYGSINQAVSVPFTLGWSNCGTVRSLGKAAHFICVSTISEFS